MFAAERTFKGMTLWLRLPSRHEIGDAIIRRFTDSDIQKHMSIENPFV